MSDAMRDQLERAYNLIQQEQLDDAVNLLRPIVARDPDNPDAWWLLANAVSEPHDAYNALTNVLRLEPNHDQARELLDNLLQEFPELGASGDASADMFSTSASDMRSTQSLGTDWDAEFKATPSAEPIRDLDDLFADYSSSVDIDALTEDDPLAAEPVANASYEIDSYFKAEGDDAEDLDAMFSSNVKNAPTTRTEENDLDALFGVKSEDKPAGAEAFNDPFGANDPDFLDDVIVPTDVVEPTMTATQMPDEKRRTRTGKSTTRQSGAVPKGDPFAPATASRRRPRWLPIVAGLALIAVVALVAWIALFRPFDTTKTDVTSNTTATADVSAAVTMAASLPELATTQQLLTQANFAHPVVTLSDGKFAVKTCETPSRNLKARFYEAISLIGQQAAKLRDQVKTAELELTSCANPDMLLYRAAAPIDAVIGYVDGGETDAATYRAAWVAN
ncbi:MAG: tetratricopeptide repeat protein [Anaerolineae bacterium]|nr:tetratricopeptide repeat protein [Anaerolineae bacterium]